ncbi:hypothetical protein AB0C04_16060 [Micromonospora sp. NPDC048909]|uniref:hypothetical protein n=1 Tax=Micromonospora sp. NPDC048909 TaxID=3155643 RepID=UPI0033F923E0
MTVIPLFAAQLLVATTPRFHSRDFSRDASDLPTLVDKGFAFFAPLDARTAPLMEPVIPLLHGGAILLVAVLIYLVGGLVTRRTGLIAAAVTGASAVLVAAAIADLLGWAVYVLRSHSATRDGYAASDGPSLLFSANYSLSGGWTSDVLFLGCWVAVAGAILFVCGRWTQDGPSPAAEISHPSSLIGERRGRSGNLALAGILPVLVLALIEGVRMVRHADKPYSLFELLGRFLYPALSPPPPREDLAYRLAHPDLDPARLTMDRWVPNSVATVVLLVLLWLLLRSVLADLPASGHRAGLVVVCWGGTLAACALTAPTVVLAECAFSGSPTGCAPWMNLSSELTNALRFGAAWGWLVALLVLLARRTLRTETPVAALEAPIHEPA